MIVRADPPRRCTLHIAEHEGTGQLRYIHVHPETSHPVFEITDTGHTNLFIFRPNGLIR